MAFIPNECSRCRLQGYDYADEARKLCHLCVGRDEATLETRESLKGILADFLRVEMSPARHPWVGCEFGKAHVGNALVGAIRQYEPDFKMGAAGGL
jgi:hypothetical protein